MPRMQKLTTAATTANSTGCGMYDPASAHMSNPSAPRAAVDPDEMPGAPYTFVTVKLVNSSHTR